MVKIIMTDASDWIALTFALAVLITVEVALIHHLSARLKGKDHE